MAIGTISMKNSLPINLSGSEVMNTVSIGHYGL
jgi:hypothetical protein